jgi:hypothetical protein
MVSALFAANSDSPYTLPVYVHAHGLAQTELSAHPSSLANSSLDENKKTLGLL